MMKKHSNKKSSAQVIAIIKLKWFIQRHAIEGMQGGTGEQAGYFPLELTLEPPEEFTDFLTNGQYAMIYSLLTNKILLVYRWKFQDGQTACYLEGDCTMTNCGKTDGRRC